MLRSSTQSLSVFIFTHEVSFHRQVVSVGHNLGPGAENLKPLTSPGDLPPPPSISDGKDDQVPPQPAKKAPSLPPAKANGWSFFLEGRSSLVAPD